MDAALEIARQAGAKPEHLRSLLTCWLAGRELDPTSRGFPPGKLLTASLPRIRAAFDAVARVKSEHPSGDGTRRLIVELADGASVESVMLARDGLCVSTQAGCAVGCVFCKTGEGGLARQLSAAEIVAQVALARARGRVRRVVFMGMGEPAHNLENVLAALRCLGGAGGLAHKSLVFSTVGAPEVFARLAAHEVRPALALSLHTTRGELRSRLLPRAPAVEPRELVESALAYCDAITWPLQVQWTLLEGVNDGDDEVEELANWLRGRRAMVNFIPWNRVDGFAYARPSEERAVAMVRGLRSRGVIATLRRSGGQDVDAACGQLRARSLPQRTAARRAAANSLSEPGSTS